MLLRVDRKWRKKDYTVGELSVDGVYFCDTLEDRDRLYFGEKKVPTQTAIPCGKYKVAMNIVSPKYSKKPEFVAYCKAKMPRILDVPQFDGILIHPGNTAGDTAGCLLVGENKAVGRVVNSTLVWKRLYIKMKAAHDRGETITIIIA